MQTNAKTARPDAERKRPDRKPKKQAPAKKAGPQTAQQTIPYREIFKDGICRVNDRLYTKSMEYEDINYQLAQADDQSAIFDGYCAFLNSFDSSLPFQLSFINHRSRPESKYKLNIPVKEDGYSDMRSEYVEMLEGQIAKANADLHYQKMVKEHPELNSTFLSRMAQKWKIKREYAKQAREAARQTAKAAGAAATTTEKAAAYAAQFVRQHKGGAVIILLLFCLFLILNSVFSALPSLGTGMMNAVVGTSYTAEDEDILGANEDYTALENELREKIANIERTHPGYDEYRYNVDELGHNPYELTSYLIAKLRTYTRENVQGELRALFEAQYKLTLTEEVEIRYRTETDTWTDEDGTTHTDTYEVPYEYYILHVRLQNKTLPMVVGSLLDAEQKEIYDITLELKGNKPYLWDDIYTSGGGSYDPGSDYTIPGEALSNPAFAALISEAEKYLGWPYVWGGSSPSTSFDCSGFVCWVYTASGVHNLPRTTATGIFNQCSYVSPADAKPGDLIFFTKTYACDGPVSHVGIYVGGGMMIHAGDPIKYASINTSYWQEHFYAFGRLN